MWFGLGMLVAAYWADGKNRLRHDFAFWGYLFGVMAFWGGLSMMDGDSELSSLSTAYSPRADLAVRAPAPRSFIVFGLSACPAIWATWYRVFEDSLLFPLRSRSRHSHHLPGRAVSAHAAAIAVGMQATPRGNPRAGPAAGKEGLAGCGRVRLGAAGVRRGATSAAEWTRCGGRRFRSRQPRRHARANVGHDFSAG